MIWTSPLLTSQSIVTKGTVEPLDMSGHIRFENVSFAYPSRPNQLALRNVSLEFPPGQVTAIVGHSGSGKSSILSLLLKFYPVSEGQIYLDKFAVCHCLCSSASSCRTV